MPKVLIVDSNSEYVRLLRSVGFSIHQSKYNDPKYNLDIIPEMDLVMFTGGADVHPIFYNGVHNGTSHTDRLRDEVEMALFDQCVKHKIKMTGICRGIQFLNVMCGGRMYQHINGHGGVLHDIIIPAKDIVVKVSSTHHQMVLLPDNAIPIAWTHPENISNVYIGPDADMVNIPEYEIEAAVYPTYNAFGVQFHPEMIWCAKDGRDYYLKILSDFMDMELVEFVGTYGVFNANKERGISKVCGN